MDNTQGMFGQDPALIQQAIQQQKQQQYSQDIQPNLFALAQRGGNQAGGMLGDTLAAATGYQDPRIADAQLGQQVQAQSMQEAQMAGIDPATDYEGFGKIAASNWLKAGKPERAYAVMQSIQGMQAQKAKTEHEVASTNLANTQAQQALLPKDNRTNEQKNIEAAAIANGLEKGSPEYNQFVGTTMQTLFKNPNISFQTAIPVGNNKVQAGFVDSSGKTIQYVGQPNTTGVGVQIMNLERGGSTSSTKTGNMGLTQEQNDALFGENGAVTRGLISPDRLNSRTAAIFANAFIKNPNTDMVKLASNASLMKNAQLMQKSMLLDKMPEIMGNMVEAGKKLDFSKLKVIGDAQYTFMSQTNNPDLIEYMTQRNDAMMTIAGVMRTVGMSDKSIQQEIESAPKAMAPEAFNGWLRGQMKSLKPRIDIANSITRQNSNPQGVEVKTPIPEVAPKGSIKFLGFE